MVDGGNVRGQCTYLAYAYEHIRDRAMKRVGQPVGLGGDGADKVGLVGQTEEEQVTTDRQAVLLDVELREEGLRGMSVCNFDE